MNMSKKIIAFFCLAVVLLSACRGSSKSANEEIGFEYDFSDLDTPFFTENDSFNTIMQSSPYYLGAQNFRMPVFAEFAELKKNKIEEAKKLTIDLYVSIKDLQGQLVPFRSAYINFLDVAYKDSPELKKFMSEVLPEIAKNFAREQSIQLVFENMEIKNLDEFSSSWLEYQKTALALDLLKYYYSDFALLVGNGVQLYTEIKTPDKKILEQAAVDFDLQMQKLGNLNEIFSKLNLKALELHTVLKQLDTADYYMAMAGVSFINDSLPDIKEKIEQLKSSNYASKEDIEFMRQYVELFGSFNESLEGNLGKIDKSKLLKLPENKDVSFLPIAEAYTFNDYVKSAKFILKGTAKLMLDEMRIMPNQEEIDSLKETTKLEWDFVKKGYALIRDEVKDEWNEDVNTVKGVYKSVQKGTGVALDIMGAATKSVFDVGFNLYHGNSISDIADEISKNVKQIENNYNAGKSGTQILKTAKDYLEGVDDFARDLGEFAGSTIDDEAHWTSWGISKVAQLTSSMFTGFGKGIYRLADQDSSSGELARGALDVALSFVGGSKVIVKGSQAIGGTAKALDLINASGLNFVERLWGKVWAGRGISNALEIESRRALEKALQASGEAIDRVFEKLVADGGKTLLENLTKGVKGSLKDFIEKSFESSLGGIKNAIRTVIAGKEGTLENYFNNVIGGAINKWFKENVKEYIDKNGVTEVSDFSEIVDCATFSYGECIDASRSLPGSVYDKSSPFFKAWAVCSRKGGICEFGVDSWAEETSKSVPEVKTLPKSSSLQSTVAECDSVYGVCVDGLQNRPETYGNYQKYWQECYSSFLECKDKL